MRKINQFLIFSTFTTETNLSIFSSKSESDHVTTRSVVLTNKITKSDTTTYFRTSSNTTKIHSPTSINDVEEPNKTTNRLLTSELITTKTNLKQNSTQNILLTTKITDLVETSVIAKINLKSSNNIIRNRVKTEKIKSENELFVWITAVLSAIISVFVLMIIVKKLVKDLTFFKCFFSLKH